MKVLFITSWYPTEQNPYFGIFVKEHAHAISVAGNELVVMALLLRKSRKLISFSVSDTIDESGVRTILVELNSIFKEFILYFFPIQTAILKAVFRKYLQPSFIPDIVHSNVVFPAGVIANALAIKIKKPHVITEHWSRIQGIMKKPVLSYFVRKAYSNADAIMPVSAFLQQRILEIVPGVRTSQFHVVGNVIRSEVFSYREKTFDSQEIRFCAIATWNNKKIPDKLPALFIQSLANVQMQSSKKIKLIMIGGGNQLDELKKLCEQTKLEVEFSGYIEKPTIAKILQTCSFLVHASTVETFGVGVAEALMTGTPVICSKVGALPELIDDSNGILCENTVTEWEIGLKKAMSSSFNYKEIAESIQKRFDQHAIGTEINKVYSRVIKSVRL